MDHDQRFKLLLHEFFQEFFELFFPAWAPRLDFSQVDWLEQELFSDPPQGERRAVDLVARLRLRQPVITPEGSASTIALMHIEVEARESLLPLRYRLFRYSDLLEYKYQLPVLPIVLFLKVGKDGIGWDSYERWFWEHRLLQFSYPYIGLPALDAQQYLQKNNWLGVALSALMKIPTEQRLAVGREAWRRLIQCPENAYRRFLLCDCVDAYLPVDEQQRRDFEHLLLTEPDPEVRAMTKTLFDKYREEAMQEGRQEGLQEGRQEGLQEGRQKGRQEGLQEGRQEGYLEGQRQSVQLLLEDKFGTLSESLRERLASLSAAELRALLLAIPRTQSLHELGLEP